MMVLLRTLLLLLYIMFIFAKTCPFDPILKKSSLTMYQIYVQHFVIIICHTLAKEQGTSFLWNLRTLHYREHYEILYYILF